MSLLTVRRALLGTLPLALSPGVVWGLSSSAISFGGGEKDIVLAVPYAVWALGFAVGAWSTIVWPRAAWVMFAVASGVAAMVVTAGLLAVTIGLGVGW